MTRSKWFPLLVSLLGVLVTPLSAQIYRPRRPGCRACLSQCPESITVRRFETLGALGDTLCVLPEGCDEVVVDLNNTNINHSGAFLDREDRELCPQRRPWFDERPVTPFYVRWDWDENGPVFAAAEGIVCTGSGLRPLLCLPYRRRGLFDFSGVKCRTRTAHPSEIVEQGPAKGPAEGDRLEERGGPGKGPGEGGDGPEAHQWGGNVHEIRVPQGEEEEEEGQGRQHHHHNHHHRGGDVRTPPSIEECPAHVTVPLRPPRTRCTPSAAAALADPGQFFLCSSDARCTAGVCVTLPSLRMTDSSSAPVPLAGGPAEATLFDVVTFEQVASVSVDFSRGGVVNGTSVSAGANSTMVFESMEVGISEGSFLLTGAVRVSTEGTASIAGRPATFSFLAAAGDIPSSSWCVAYLTGDVGNGTSTAAGDDDEDEEDSLDFDTKTSSSSSTSSSSRASAPDWYTCIPGATWSWETAEEDESAIVSAILPALPHNATSVVVAIALNGSAPGGTGTATNDPFNESAIEKPSAEGNGTGGLAPGAVAALTVFLVLFITGGFVVAAVYIVRRRRRLANADKLGPVTASRQLDFILGYEEDDSIGNHNFYNNNNNNNNNNNRDSDGNVVVTIAPPPGLTHPGHPHRKRHHRGIDITGAADLPRGPEDSFTSSSGSVSEGTSLMSGSGGPLAKARPQSDADAYSVHTGGYHVDMSDSNALNNGGGGDDDDDGDIDNDTERGGTASQKKRAVSAEKLQLREEYSRGAESLLALINVHKSTT